MLHLSKISSVFSIIHFYFLDLLYIWWFCRKNKKNCKCIFDALLANQIRLTYGDFEKYLKIYEIAMKNGNFIIFFWANFGKNVFYYGEQGDLHGYGQKGRFWKNMLFFSSRYMYIFCFSLRKECGFCFFFLMSFFLIYKGIFQKTAKKAKPAF